MHEFKIGDKVRFTEDYDVFCKLGQTGIITSFDPMLEVTMDKPLGDFVEVYTQSHRLELVAPVSPKILPVKFKLNPDGNEDLSRAMQVQLARLGYSWEINIGDAHPSAKWLYVGERGKYLLFSESDNKPNMELLGIGDLFTRTRAKPKPVTFKIANRTLTIKDGYVTGPEFNGEVYTIITQLDSLLLTRKVGQHSAAGLTFQIGCEKVSHDQLIELRAWLADNNK